MKNEINGPRILHVTPEIIRIRRIKGEYL